MTGVDSSARDPRETTATPLVQLPVGQPIDLFSAVGDLLDAALEGTMLGPGSGPVAAEVLLPEGVTSREAADRLRHAAAIVRGVEYVPVPRDPDDPGFTVGRMTADEEGGVTFGIGGPREVANQAALNLIGAFLPALDDYRATNYLSFDAVHPETHQRYALIVCRPDGKTPHQLRTEFEAEAERLRGQRDAALALHRPDGESFCKECSWGRRPPVAWPCRTAKTLGMQS